MENTHTPTIINTVEHNEITIYRTDICRNTQAHTHKNPMAWVIYYNGAPRSFKTLKAAKETIDNYTAQHATVNLTDYKGNYWTYGPVNGRFDVVVLTEQEWRDRRNASKVGA